MRRTLVGSLLVVVLAGLGALAPAAEKPAKGGNDKAFLGTWSGTWTGGAGGTFELKVGKDAHGKLSGSVSPSANDGTTYTAPLKSVAVEGGTLTATFEPPDSQLEVTMTATVQGAASKGAYKVRDKAQGTEVEAGSWTAKKK